MSVKSEIIIQEIEKEGLSEKFIKLIEQDLCDEILVKSIDESSEFITFFHFLLQRSLIATNVQVQSKKNCDILEKYFKQELLNLKKQILKLSMFSFAFSSYFVSQELADAYFDFKDFNGEMFKHYKVLQSYNTEIQKNYSTDALSSYNLICAYGDFINGMKISIENCTRVFKQKALIYRNFARRNSFFSVTYPYIDFSFERDREILNKSYTLIKEYEKELVKI